ncbi:hypothetical protein HGRIS_010547 [Hohenbuehelia grisea]|uniref:FAD/NAD(P)-binding domain-containing protein n=1 Tax=Hohenbuehelia grisea TaxID=104357 RepID=A0ABR3IXA4_9AGAR
MERRCKVAIIGAGVGGLAFAIALRRQLKCEDFIIFEKASDVGGTWRDNRYPGCSSDIAMHFYSLSTDLKADWESTHEYAPVINEYWAALARKYELYSRTAFNTNVTSAAWDATAQVYRIETENLKTGEKTVTTAQILVSAIGVLEVPRFPSIPGLEDFKGAVFHSARWDSMVNLENKQVGVIGNGASATQFVPIISRKPGISVTQFSRTPNWVSPPLKAKISGLWIWAFKHIPGLTRLYRWRVYFQSDVLYLVFASRFIRWLTMQSCKQYIRKTAPKEYQEHLIPNYPLGCKRILFDTDYLDALHRDNLGLNWDGIEEITADGIVTKTGHKIPLDVLILATGFDTDSFPVSIQGTRNSIQEYFDTHGAPRAYLGTTVPGFPNFFTIGGPNTATGHTSVIFTEEVQIDYSLQLIKPVLEGKVSSFEVQDEPTDAYNEKIQNRLSKSVFVQCQSWYRKGGDGINNSIFPGSQFRFWWWLRRPNWSHYTVVNGSAWLQERRAAKQRTVMAVICGIVGLAAFYVLKRG